MQNTTDSGTTNYFNGWVIAGLFINAFMIFAIWLTTTESGDFQGDFNTFLYVLMGLASLVYIGAFAVLLDQVKFGAILIIIGSVVLTPIGAIAMFGGLRMLQKLKDRNLPHNPLFEQDDTPITEVSAENYGQQLPLGIAMLIGAGFIMMIDPISSGILFGLGVFYIVLNIAIKNNSTVVFYPQFAKVRVALGSWRFIVYEDILDIILQSEKFLKIRHRQGEEEKEIILISKMWGTETLLKIQEEFQIKSQLPA